MLLELAQAQKKVVGVGYNLRFHPGLARLRAILFDAGQLECAVARSVLHGGTCMDRRNFLRTTGAAAVAAGTAAAPALAVETQSANTPPVARPGARLLTLGSEGLKRSQAQGGRRRALAAMALGAIAAAANAVLWLVMA